MKRKGVILLLVGFLFLLIFIAPFLFAEEDDSEQALTDNPEMSQVDLAYDCLESRILDKCNSMSYDEKIFSLLAVGKCKEALLNEKFNNMCFPKSGCKIKTTAQAILALNNIGESTTQFESWLISQNKTPNGLTWYLQIDSPEPTTCTISYAGNQFSTSIGEDKKLSSGSNCLKLAQGNYWLEISQSCYNNEFQISCDKQFITSLLFKKQDSSKIYVSEKTSFAQAGDKTIEKINSYCFTNSGVCDYEGSLWAAIVLDYLNYDISYYMPYLLTMGEGNSKYLPESFLYILTNDADYRTQLLTKQKLEYWEESGDKFYDTGVALLPFSYEDPKEKTNTIDWLFKIQDSNGCWKTSLRNTAFLLFSIWPREVEVNITAVQNNTPINDLLPINESPVETIETNTDCEIDAGGFCMSRETCEDAGGNELASYASSCLGINVCCDKEEVLETCDKLNGNECPSGETCSTSTTTASDTYECCLGYCTSTSTQTDCEKYNGICRSSCNSDEEESSDSCDYSDVCCVEKSTPESEPSHWWIWVLLILIVLVLIAIIFRDKLRPYWFRLKSKFGKKPKSPPKPRRPLMPFSRQNRRLVPRRPLISRSSSKNMQKKPSQMQPPKTKSINKPTQLKQKKPVEKKSSAELDDVLKKLKDMGK